MPRFPSSHSLPAAALLLAGLAMATSACSRTADSPAAESGAQDWASLRGFTRIEATGPDNVVITIGKDFSVRADGDPRTVAQLDIRVKGDRLAIGRKPTGLWSWAASGDGAIIHVIMPAVTGIDLTGSGDVSLDRAEGPALDLSLTGPGDIGIGQVKLGTLRAEITGSGSIALTGTADRGDLSITGSGDMHADGLKIGRGAASLMGSGDIAFASDGPVAIKIMGSGDVTVKGKAQCDIRQTGSGEARCAP